VFTDIECTNGGGPLTESGAYASGGRCSGRHDDDADRGSGSAGGRGCADPCSVEGRPHYAMLADSILHCTGLLGSTHQKHAGPHGGQEATEDDGIRNEEF
jgi:hypothetical protein